VVTFLNVINVNQTILSPNTARINCTATAKPRAIIQWIRNGVVVEGNTARITMTNFTQGNCSTTSPPSQCAVTSILEIVNTVPNDAGEYMCNASNPAGGDIETISLIVNGTFIDALYICDWIYRNRSKSHIGRKLRS